MIQLKVNELLKKQKKTKYWFVKKYGRRLSITYKNDE